jgi:MFS family permease
MRAAMGSPGFRRLYLGLTASMFGDSLMLLVMSMWVKSLTHSNAAAGLTFLFLTLPALVSPLFGYVVDRVERRRFLVVANLLSAVALTPLLFVEDAGDVWMVYLVAFLYGVSFSVIPAALNGLMKDMLDLDVLVEANAMLSVTREAWRLVGPLAGATLFAWVGGATVAMVDGATFLVAAAVVWSLRVRETPVAPPEHHWRSEVMAGLGYLRTVPVLLHTTVALSLCLLVIGFTESSVYAILDAFDKPVEFVGPLATIQGVGAIAGGVLSSRIIRRAGEARAVVVGLLVMAVGLAGISFAPWLWLVLAWVGVFGFSLPLLIVAFNTMLQKLTPSRLMGRVSTTTEVLATTPQAVSIATGALLVTLLDYRVIFAIMTAGTLVAAGYLLVALRGRMSSAALVSAHLAEPR